MSLEGTEPILCSQIIRQVDQHLIELLTSLDAAEWDLPTITPQWSVRDVAAHLVDGVDIAAIVDDGRVEMKLFDDLLEARARQDHLAQLRQPAEVRPVAPGHDRREPRPHRPHGPAP